MLSLLPKQRRILPSVSVDSTTADSRKHSWTKSAFHIIVWFTVWIVLILYFVFDEDDGEREYLWSVNNFQEQEHRKLCNAKYVDFAQSLMPLSDADIIGFTCISVALTMAAVTGIGGGGVLIPIFIIVMGFRPKHAIPLSSITVCGGSVANTLLNIRKRHPLADRPIVDWDLVFAVEPLGLVGALLGTFLNKIIREGFLGLMLIVFLGIISHITFKRAMDMYYKENQRILSDIYVVSSPSPLSSYSFDENQVMNYVNADGTHGNTQSSNVSRTLPPMNNDNLNSSCGPSMLSFEQEQHIMEDNERQILRPSALIFGTTVIVVLFINIMKGGEAFPSPLGFSCGSPEFWCANLLMFIWLFIVYLHARVYLMDKIQQKDRIGFSYVEGDIHWDSSSVVIFPLVSSLSGFFAGMFGIGGGVIKVPLLLALDVHPAVASATSSVSIFFTSFIANTSFAVFGLIVVDYAIVCFFFGMIFTYIGQKLFSWSCKSIKKKTAALRDIAIVFVIALVVLLSTILMAVEEIQYIARGCEQALRGSGGLCGNGSVPH